MKKSICMILAVLMVLCLCGPAVGTTTEEENFTTEELLAMDPELDTDGDGIVDVIEIVYGFDRYDFDTDGDGVNDYVEFCVTCTDVLVADGDVDTDGDGLTNAQECARGTNADDRDSDNDYLSDYNEIYVYGTNPLSKDTDGDGIPDNEESDIGFHPIVTSVGAAISTSGGATPAAVTIPSVPVIGPKISDGGSSTSTYSATLHTKYGDSSVSYTYDSKWFFEDNTGYNQDLAVISSLLSAIAYDENYLSNTSTTDSLDALKDWFAKHAFVDYKVYDLDALYSDQHVSEMFVGRRTYTYSGETRNIICVVIRGTNGTLEEWQSNFDVGTTADFSSYSEWTNANNHMGFDITANRLNQKLKDYLSENGLSNGNNVFWITGHSRGGALANLLAAKRVDAEEEVFAYTFAAPATVECDEDGEMEAVEDNYPSIFNIINEDDLVPKLPLTAWDFVRYGRDLKNSIEECYAGEWDCFVSGELDYTSRPECLRLTLAAFEGIADSRDECYTYRNYGYIYRGAYLDRYTAQVAAETHIAGYPTNAQPYCYWNFSNSAELYGFVVYQSPAFMMQILAAKMGQQMSDVGFFTLEVAGYLKISKAMLIALKIANGMDNPHYVESYYLLATNYEGSEGWK